MKVKKHYSKGSLNRIDEVKALVNMHSRHRGKALALKQLLLKGKQRTADVGGVQIVKTIDGLVTIESYSIGKPNVVELPEKKRRRQRRFKTVRSRRLPALPPLPGLPKRPLFNDDAIKPCEPEGDGMFVGPFGDFIHKPRRIGFVCCNVSTNHALKRLVKISEKTSFGKQITRAGAKVNVKQAQKKAEPAFGKFECDSVPDFYKQLITRVYFQFARRTHNMISLSPSEIYFKSKDSDDNISFTFDSLDPFTVLKGVLSLHLSYVEIWNEPDDTIKATNLYNFMKTTFPEKEKELELFLKELKDFDDAKDEDDDEDDGIRIDKTVNLDFRRPDSLPVDGLSDLIQNSKDNAMLYYLDRLLFEVVLPNIYNFKKTKGQKAWRWVEVREAMAQCCLFKLTPSLYKPFLPSATLFANTMFAIICNHQQKTPSFSKDDECEVVLGEKVVRIRCSSVNTMSGRLDKLDRNPNSAVYSHVKKIVKYIRMYRLDLRDKV